MKGNTDLSRSRRENTGALSVVIFFLTALISASAHGPTPLWANTFSGLATPERVEPGAGLAELREPVRIKLDELRAGADFPGATVGFVLADGTSASVSTGLADVENNTPLRPNDRMLAGSILRIP